MSNTTSSQNHSSQGFHIMAKPYGPVCNLDCRYCFYNEKKVFFPGNDNYRMSDEVLEAYIRKTLASKNRYLPEIPFAWQGGEPTLIGLDFFRKAIEFQHRYGEGKRITNSLQTNGTLLNDEWCEFLAKHHFLVGLSLDGPKDMHDCYRRDRDGKSVFEKVMHGLELLKKHAVEFNILACVNRETSQRPIEIYRFFKEHGVQYIQFIPIVERLPSADDEKLGLKLGRPPVLGGGSEASTVTSWTVDTNAYGDFMIMIFDEWVRNDVGSIFIMNFEWALASFAGIQPATCFFMNRCGRAVMMEHNGDVYSCDHFMYPEYRLGNILTDELDEMIGSKKQMEFGALKQSALPRDCRECSVLFACRGGCPKHRFLKTSRNEPCLNYLCAGYRKYFRHIQKYMMFIVHLLEQGLPAMHVMEAVKGPLVIEFNQ